MKKVIALAAMAMLTLASQAQIVSSRSSITTGEVIEVPRYYQGWSTFGVEYLPSNFSADGHSEAFNGFALNYTKASSLTQSLPLFLEWGIGAQFSLWSENEENIHFASLKVPVNLIYDFQIPGTNIKLDPYVGVKFRGNVWGEKNDEYYDETYNLFDSDEYDWKRLQIGMQIGLKARFSDSFFVGIGYGADFNEIAEDIKVNELSLSIGLVF